MNAPIDLPQPLVLPAGPDLDTYERIIVAFSGGKDSVACVLHLLELGVPRERIELWHHDVDGGPSGKPFMDWPVTRAYCSAFAAALGLPIYFSWKVGGFEREMIRHRERTQPTAFEEPLSRGWKRLAVLRDFPLRDGYEREMGSVQTKVMRLGLAKPKARWTDAEEALLRELVEQDVPHDEQVRRTGKSDQAVKHKRQELGLVRWRQKPRHDLAAHLESLLEDVELLLRAKRPHREILDTIHEGRASIEPKRHGEPT